MKKYRATWDDSYESPQTQIVNDAFFVEDRGYDAADIAKIYELKVDEGVNLDGNHHQITRIE